MARYVVGQIVKSQGLKGEVKVRIETDFPETFKTRKTFFIGKSESTAVEKPVRLSRLDAGFVYLSVEAISDRTAADALRGYFLYIDEQSLAPLPENVVYVHELIGLAAVDESGSALGTVTDVLRFPAGDTYEITQARSGKKVLVPAIDEFVAEVNVALKRVILRRFSEFVADEKPDETDAPNESDERDVSGEIEENAD